MRSRKLLALIFSLLAIAPALAGYMTLLGAGVGGSIAPVVTYTAGTDSFPDTALSFSRPSLATMFDSTGKLTYAPNNLALNTATLGTQSVTVQVGVNYLVSFASGGGSIALSGAGAGTVTSASPVKITASTTTLTLTVAGTVTNAVVAAVTYETTPRTGDQVITTSAAYYGPRIDYDPNTLAVKGLLIEEARTNVAIWGEDLSNAGWAWTTYGNSVTANATAGPAGTTTAALITPTAGSGLHRSERGISGFSLGATVSLSIFAKPNGYNNIQLGVYDTAYRGANFNVSTGAVANTDAGVTATIKPAANGFYRCTITYTTAGATTLYWEAYVRPNGTIDYNTWVADGTSGIYVDKAQMEVGSFATSYIPTAASSVTRAADVVQFTGAALTALQGSAGTTIVQTSDAANSGSSQALIGSNAVSNMYMRYVGTAVSSLASDGTALAASGTVSLTSASRSAIAWGASSRSLVHDGGTVATDAKTFSGVSAAYLGAANGGAQYWFNGHFASFAIYNQRLPDATLQAKSVVGASY